MDVAGLIKNRKTSIVWMLIDFITLSSMLKPHKAFSFNDHETDFDDDHAYCKGIKWK